MTTAAATTPGIHDIQLDVLQLQEQENGTTSILDQISYGFVSVGGFIYQNSYIFTNILMMVGLIDIYIYIYIHTVQIYIYNLKAYSDLIMMKFQIGTVCMNYNAILVDEACLRFLKS